MPFSIRKVGKNKYQVYNTATGEIHSKGTTKKKAEGQFRLLQGIARNELIDLEGGAPPARTFVSANQFKQAILNARRRYESAETPNVPANANLELVQQQFDNMRPAGIDEYEWEPLVRFIAGLEPEDMIDEWDDFLDDPEKRQAIFNFGLMGRRMDDAVRRIQTVEAIQAEQGDEEDDEDEEDEEDEEMEASGRRKGGANKRSYIGGIGHQRMNRGIDALTTRMDALEQQQQRLVQQISTLNANRTAKINAGIFDERQQQQYERALGELQEMGAHTDQLIATTLMQLLQLIPTADENIEQDMLDALAEDDPTGSGRYSTASPQYQPRRFL